MENNAAGPGSGARAQDARVPEARPKRAAPVLTNWRAWSSGRGAPQNVRWSGDNQAHQQSARATTVPAPDPRANLRANFCSRPKAGRTHLQPPPRSSGRPRANPRSIRSRGATPSPGADAAASARCSTTERATCGRSAASASDPRRTKAQGHLDGRTMVTSSPSSTSRSRPCSAWASTCPRAPASTP